MGGGCALQKKGIKRGGGVPEACPGRWHSRPCGQGQFPLNGQEAIENSGCTDGGVGLGTGRWGA